MPETKTKKKGSLTKTDLVPKNSKSSKGLSKKKASVTLKSKKLKPEDPKCKKTSVTKKKLTKPRSKRSSKVIKKKATSSNSNSLLANMVKPHSSANSAQKIESNELLVPDTLTQYLMKIRNYPVLTKEKEHELAIRYYEDNDREAAEILVRSNLKFVVKVAMEYSKFGARLIDIIQEGNVGLMHALKEYNPYKGVKLISYAVWWIRGYIQDYMMKQQSIVKIGTNQKQRKLFYHLEKEHAKIIKEGLESSPLLLSQRLDVKEKDVVDMQQRLSQKDLSLDNTVGDDNNLTWLEGQADETDEPADEVFIQAEQIELLKEKIEHLKEDLNPKEIQLLELRILNDTPVTLKSLGDEWGVTREAARQTEARLIEKIKKAFLDE